MERDETKIGVAALGLGALYFGIRGICSWLINRTYSQKPTKEITHIVGKLSQDIGIYSYENNPKKWSDLEEPEDLETFDLVPAYFQICKQSDDRIVLQLPTQTLICKFGNTVDLQFNYCQLIKSKPYIDNAYGNYNGILNYPTQLVLTLKPDEQVIVYGYLDTDDIFQITRLSNYSVEKYNGVLRAKKMMKTVIWLCGFAAIGGFVILFPRYKE